MSHQSDLIKAAQEWVAARDDMISVYTSGDKKILQTSEDFLARWTRLGHAESRLAEAVRDYNELSDRNIQQDT